ncbi:hypothetical protein [Sinomonas sp. P47F7]|uniref:hypothetical protein n=1 Tax=Sinomonas sp. P47F7 TaxID=3410987 RepID=UPI003BF56E9E
MINASSRSRRRSAAAALTAGPAAVVLGLAAHIASGGAAPPTAVVLALVAFVSLGAAVAARLPLPAWGIGIASALVQQILHVVFTALAGANAPLFPAAGHHHGGSTAPSSASAPAASETDVHLLVVAHVAAALLTALVVLWALASAERPAGAKASRLAERAPSGVEQKPLPRAGREPSRLGVFIRRLVHAP